MIYHLTTDSELRALTREGCYRPASLAREGFVHCAAAPSVVPIANDFFQAPSDRVLVLEIDPGRLGVEVRHEPPAPLPGGTTHLQGVATFPHVYGPIAVASIQRIGILRKANGQFAWPDEWIRPEHAFV